MRTFEAVLIAATAIMNLTISFASGATIIGHPPSMHDLVEIRGGECGNPFILGPACTLEGQDTCTDHPGNLQTCNDANFACGYDCNSVHPTYYDNSGQGGPLFDLVFKGCGQVIPPLYEHHVFKAGCRYLEFSGVCHCSGVFGSYVDCGTYRTFGDGSCGAG